MRIMAIDYGDARTGVAISDLTGTLTGFTTVIQSRREEEVLSQLVQLISQSSEGPRAELYRSFAQKLEEASGLPVHLWDERRTTIEAHNILHESGKRMKAHKKNVDAVAASLILEGYLIRKRMETVENGPQD